jgi:hypothetical protein
VDLFSVFWREQGTNIVFVLSTTMFVVDRNSVKYAIHTKHHTQNIRVMLVVPLLNSSISILVLRCLDLVLRCLEQIRK